MGWLKVMRSLKKKQQETKDNSRFNAQVSKDGDVRVLREQTKTT